LPVHGYVVLSRPRRYTLIVETAGRARPLRRADPATYKMESRT
jgi:hypothetical protein